MPGPCSGKNLMSYLVTDYIQKRRGDAAQNHSDFWKKFEISH